MSEARRKSNTDVESRLIVQPSKLLTGSHRQTRVHAVASLVSTNCISLRRVTNGADDGSSNGGVWMRPRNRDGVDSKSVRVCSDWNVIGLGELGSWNAIGCCKVKEVRVRDCFTKIPIRRRRQSAKHVPFSTRAFLLTGFSSVGFRSSDSSSWSIFSISTRTEESIAGVMLLIMSFVSVFVSLSKDCDDAERISKENRFFASC